MTRVCLGASIVMTLLLAASSVDAQDETIDADRPHVGTGTHVVPLGQVQFELGGQFQRAGSQGAFASPVLMRLGLGDRIEARLASDGLLIPTGTAESGTTFANAQVSAKVRLFGDREEPWLSVLPAFTLNANDPSMTLLVGTALTERAHVEANYGIGSVSGDEVEFLQHLVTGAITYATTRTLTTYVETAWWSRQRPEAGAVSFVDFGAIYALSPHVLVDGGALVGLTDDTTDYGIFAGLSFVVGTPHHARPASFRAPSTSVFRAGQGRD
jgi:hypothetical protein